MLWSARGCEASGSGLLASRIGSPEGEQELELAAGEVIAVTGATAPIEVWAVAG